jgi:hypothetical protein
MEYSEERERRETEREERQKERQKDRKRSSSPFSLSLSLSLSLFHTHTHTLTPLSLTHTHTLSLSLSPLCMFVPLLLFEAQQPRFPHLQEDGPFPLLRHPQPLFLTTERESVCVKERKKRQRKDL